MNRRPYRMWTFKEKVLETLKDPHRICRYCANFRGDYCEITQLYQIADGTCSQWVEEKPEIESDAVD